MKRFIMRLAEDKLEVMYETRNTQKQKQKNIYRYIYLLPHSNSSLCTP